MPARLSTAPLEIPLGGGRLRYWRMGHGPDLVLLHGLLGSGRQWAASAEALATGFTCWIPELPGIALSDAVADCSLAGLSGWLEGVVAGLGLSRFGLIGSSCGGAVGLEFAARSNLRQRLVRMVLAAPAHPFWTPTNWQRRLLRPPWTRLATACGAWLPLALHRRLLARSYGNPARLRRERVAAYRALLGHAGMAAAIAAYGRDWTAQQERLRAALPAVKTPVLLVWGERDAVVPAATAEALLRHLPTAELATLPGLGHLPFDEDPEAFTRAVLPFLAMGPGA